LAPRLRRAPRVMATRSIWPRRPVGVKAGDMPDLHHQEAKSTSPILADAESGAGLNGGGEIAPSLVTASGIEATSTSAPSETLRADRFRQGYCVGQETCKRHPPQYPTAQQTTAGADGQAVPSACGGRGGAGGSSGRWTRAEPRPGRMLEREAAVAAEERFLSAASTRASSRPHGRHAECARAGPADSSYRGTSSGKALTVPSTRSGRDQGQVLAYAVRSTCHCRGLRPDALKAKAARIQAYKIHPGMAR